jgi:acetylornithine/N-succinyldiaminopimelate aminotransferase
VLVASAALAACRKIGDPAFLAEVRRKAALLGDLLAGLQLRRAAVKDVRGAGMIWGVQVDGEAAAVVERAREARLLLCTAGPDVVRVVPPLTATDGELAKGVEILEESL